MSSKAWMTLGTGVILGYRFGNREQNPNQVLVKILSTILKNPHNLVGARVLVRDGYGNTYYGRVIKVHGSGKNKVVIARFNNNLPGQVIGSRVDIFKLRSS
ncbi:MAG: 50S ribosomal protein L35ae [Desulfurococcaceae archaeon]|jgi:ribosomal protein L35AE/L33A|nr:50S ribosomal protein L35ae [Desulfurococcaceae archaeon]